MRASELRKKWESVDVSLSAVSAINNTAPTAEAAQKEQLYQGVNGGDEPILPPYTRLTVFLKTQKGQPTDRVTLLDTGDYYGGIKASAQGETFTIQSSDGKAAKLEAKYGKNILGLGTEARVEYIRTLKPEFIKQIRSYLR